MEIGKKLHQLRKLAGMTQEQLAEKLNVSRQTVSKWEGGTTLPDLDSMVRISRMFQVSLDELLLEEEGRMREKEDVITLEDMMKINLHNRRMTLLLVSGIIFMMVGALGVIVVSAISSATTSIEYMLYRYIAVGGYTYVPVNHEKLFIPAAGAGIVGVLLCLCYLGAAIKGRTKGKRK